MPIFRRLAWHLGRVRRRLDRRAVLWILGALCFLVLIAAGFVTLFEGPFTPEKFGESLYWALTTLLGAGDANYVSSAVGRLLGAGLVVMSLTLVALISGLLISFIIDVVLREGQGMGSAGFQDHIVVCGWNPSAREMLDELRVDQAALQVVLLCGAEQNPAGPDVYFVRGDPTNATDLERAGIKQASAAIVFPEGDTEESDIRSILVVMAIETIAPEVRTVVEVTHPHNVRHARRARADEVVSTSEIGAHLLARSATYPGIADLVMDLISGGEGSELYRIRIPQDWSGRTVGDFSDAMRRSNRTILLALVRAGVSQVNPETEFVLEPQDEALVLAESLGGLEPSELGLARNP